MIIKLFELFVSFFKIGIFGFGGGYSMLSMIIGEADKFSISAAQMADLNALDMVVPGPIAINAATYVGYLYAGVFGAVFATFGVILPSFIIVTLIMRFIAKYRGNKIMDGFLTGVKPAAVGLIAAGAATIAASVLLQPNAVLSAIFTNPLETISIFLVAVFAVTAVANIRFKVNPILLTVLAGIAGAFLAK